MPCPVGELPEVDVVVISHCHYDHLDRPTLKSLLFPSSHSPSIPPRVHMFAPLNNDHLFESISAPKSNYHCLDWWQSRDVTVHLPAASATAASLQTNKITETDTAVEVKSSPTQTSSTSSNPATAIRTTFRLHCTPAQHWGNRHLFDRWTTLWSSWAVESNPVNPSTDLPVNESTTPNKKVWFGGDTGYRSVRHDEDEDSVPVCPAFKQVGDAFGEFDLGLIPIGAYEPRGALSPMHCAPQDSVRVFKDIRAKKAIGMHWGTWVLSAEEVMGPAEKLKEECAKLEIEEGVFGVIGIGECVFV